VPDCHLADSSSISSPDALTRDNLIDLPAFLSLPPPFRAGIGYYSLSKASSRSSGELRRMANRLSSVRLRPRAERAPPSATRPKNRLLAALPTDDFERVRLLLKTVPVRAKQVLHKKGERFETVYFLNGGMASITTALSDGTLVEAATVGDEGLLGVEAFLSADAVATGETLIQVPDTSAEIMDADDFRREVSQPGALRTLVGRYTQVIIAQMMQSAACNALHEVPQRAARWLLMTHDRMHEQNFTLSHEFLAVMLGVQRPTVSVIAATMQRAGLIRYMHGHVSVLDRKGLEAQACECYAIIRAQFERLRQ
jgi:CRP-like cAMP-binding protein